MYDDLTSLMLDATDTLLPPPGAASRALRDAAKTRKRSALLAGTGGVAAVGLVAAGISHIPRGTHAVYAAAGSPSCAGQLQEAPGQSASDTATFDALTLPDTLPGFPVNLWTSPAADSFQRNDPGATGRLWGWDAAHYKETPLGKGAVEGTPVGPQLRLSVDNRPDLYKAGSNGRLAGRTVDGSLYVRCRPALISHDAHDLYVTLTYDHFSISAMGGNGATVSDLVATVDAISGLDGADATGALSPPTQEPSLTAFAGLHAPVLGLPRPTAAATPSGSDTPMPMPADTSSLAPAAAGPTTVPSSLPIPTQTASS